MLLVAARLALGRPAPANLRRLGDYELLEEAAHGGMGGVFRARQVSLDRTGASKVPHHRTYRPPLTRATALGHRPGTSTSPEGETHLSDRALLNEFEPVHMDLEWREPVREFAVPGCHHPRRFIHHFALARRFR